MPNFDVSPFPGMNPYIEGPNHWADFHHEFISTLRQAIGDRLPEPYYASVGELVMLVSPETDDRPQRREPDVLVGHAGTRRVGAESPGGAAAAVAVLEPLPMANVVFDDPHTEGYIEIRRMPAGEFVTVIELLSPTNKRGDGRGIYLQKRRQLLGTPANIVEVDLIRAGRRLQLNRPLPPDDYYCFVSRGDRRPACDVYHWSVRDPLPAIPVPLRPPDADVVVGLADPFRVAFARGRYGRFIDYAEPPPASPFAADDAAWAAEVGRHTDPTPR